MFQYYLDLGTNYGPEDEDVLLEEGASGYEPGYLSMNSMALNEPTDYTKMSLAPPPPESEKLIVDLKQADNKKSEDDERYVNFDFAKKNAAKDRLAQRQNDFEVQPLIHNVDETQFRESPGRRRKMKNGSPVRVNNTQDINRNEDSDSGHESFAPGSSPDKCDENDGYLSPKSMNVQEMFEMNGISPKVNSPTKNVGNGQAKALGSRENGKYNYRDLPPPDYRAVMESAVESNV